MRKLTYYEFSEARKRALKEIDVEEQVMRMYRRGVTPMEIARILGMSFEGVKQTIKSGGKNENT